MRAPGGRQDLLDALVARFHEAGRAVTAIHDSPGFIGQRIAAMVANLGCEMAQIGVASPDDIDKAMTLGLNYPFGPLALADAMGPRSEEHTSELQSLMRISYAVFCLKKKITTTTTIYLH